MRGTCASPGWSSEAVSRLYHGMCVGGIRVLHKCPGGRIRAPRRPLLHPKQPVLCWGAAVGFPCSKGPAAQEGMEAVSHLQQQLQVGATTCMLQARHAQHPNKSTEGSSPCPALLFFVVRPYQRKRKMVLGGSALWFSGAWRSRCDPRASSSAGCSFSASSNTNRGWRQRSCVFLTWSSSCSCTEHRELLGSPGRHTTPLQPGGPWWGIRVSAVPCPGVGLGQPLLASSPGDSPAAQDLKANEVEPAREREWERACCPREQAPSLLLPLQDEVPELAANAPSPGGRDQALVRGGRERPAQVPRGGNSSFLNF